MVSDTVHGKDNLEENTREDADIRMFYLVPRFEFVHQGRAHQSAPNSYVTWSPVAGVPRTSLSKTLPPPFSGAFPAPIFPQFPIKFFCNRLQSFDRGIVVIYQRNPKKKPAKDGCCRDAACCRAQRSPLPPVRWGPTQRVRVTCGGGKWRRE